MSEEDLALEQLRGTLRPEHDWLRVFPGQINVLCSPDQAAHKFLPATKQDEVSLVADSRMKVHQLKEKLAATLSVGIPAVKIDIRGTPLKKSLKDSLSLAFYNVPDGANLTFSVK